MSKWYPVSGSNVYVSWLLYRMSEECTVAYLEFYCLGGRLLNLVEEFLTR